MQCSTILPTWSDLLQENLMAPVEEDPGGDGNKERTILVATRDTLETFHDDVQYLWSCTDVPIYENPPSALEFLRKHVAVSRPCIIRNSILRPEHGKSHNDTNVSTRNYDAAAIPLTMTLDDLVQLFPEANDDESAAAASPQRPLLPPLCVDVTPDGHGDCLRRVSISESPAIPKEEKRVFVKPLETSMSLSKFCHRLRKGRAKQQQQYYGYENDQRNALDTVFSSSSSLMSCLQGDPHGKDNLGHTINTDDDSLFEDCVLYYSRQNDCLREELSPLWNLKQSSMDHCGSDDTCNVSGDDAFLFPRSFPWAEEAFFGSQPPATAAGNSSGGSVGPDAVNLWMGDERAVSAMHKDHYENLFYVLSGEKVFGLCPPSDAPFLYEREALSGRFEVSSGDGKSHDNEESECHQQRRNWSVVLDREDDDGGSVGMSSSTSETQGYSTVHWIGADLFGRRSRRNSVDDFPLSKHAHPITVTVRAGELLYLPSLWFHRVTQTRETVGINYWYDMNFESPLWCYFHLLQQLRPFNRASTTNSNDED